MSYETKTTICGWTAVAITAILLGLCVAFHKPYVPPPASYWPTEPFTVNTAQITSMERAGADGTRLWLGGAKAGQSILFAEQPSFFEGPTRIVTATRIKEWNH